MVVVGCDLDDEEEEEEEEEDAPQVFVGWEPCNQNRASSPSVWGEGLLGWYCFDGVAREPNGCPRPLSRLPAAGVSCACRPCCCCCCCCCRDVCDWELDDNDAPEPNDCPRPSLVLLAAGVSCACRPYCCCCCHDVCEWKLLADDDDAPGESCCQSPSPPYEEEEEPDHRYHCDDECGDAWERPYGQNP